jgi:acyl-CoA oxidase
MHARLVLARAVTVAIRYTAIRRQFRDRDGNGTGPEMAVLDYPTVQIRLLPLLATAFALHYSGEAMRDLYQQTRKNVNAGDFSALADLHSTSSGLKSLCTTLTADGIEVCRRALGGHGFGGGSGLIQIKNDYSAKPTVEGDNWMITQQVASYLIKKTGSAIKCGPNSKAADAIDKGLKDYLRSKSSANAPTFDVLRSDEQIVEAFQRRAAHLSYEAYQNRIVKKRSWNELLIQLHRLSEAQSQAILVFNFHRAVSSTENLSAESRDILTKLFRLFALYTMDVEARQCKTSFLKSNVHKPTNSSLTFCSLQLRRRLKRPARSAA